MWEFGSQGVYPVTGSAKAVDQVTVKCTYDNSTDGTVTFGEDTTNEMCIGVLFYYPLAPGGMGGSAARTTAESARRTPRYFPFVFSSLIFSVAALAIGPFGWSFRNAWYSTIASFALPHEASAFAR